jgi:hypothetical protein
MDLHSKVVFNLYIDELLADGYNLDGRYVNAHHNEVAYVKNMAEFQQFIAKLVNFAKSGIDKGTYKIKIQRNVIVCDEDDRVTFNSVTFPDKPMTIILSTTDKLLYVNDINSLFQPKFPDFYLASSKLIDSNPIYIESFDGKNVKYGPLVQGGGTNYVVFDTKLNPLWPAGATANPLIQLLSKTTEPVR